MKIATSIQYHSVKVGDETTPTKDVYFEIRKETGVLEEFTNKPSSPVILILIKLRILKKYLKTHDITPKRQMKGLSKKIMEKLQR